MKASEIIKLLEVKMYDYGDLKVTCKAGDNYFETDWLTVEENEIIIDCKY